MGQAVGPWWTVPISEGLPSAALHTAVLGLQTNWPQSPTAKSGIVLFLLKKTQEESQGPDEGEHPLRAKRH